MELHIAYSQVMNKEFAYVCGFIWADGWIRRKGSYNEIRVECVREDMEELYPVFCKTGNWKIYYRNRKNRRPQARLSLTDKNLVESLCEKKYHLHSNASANQAIDVFPEALKKYWFRGLVDGDGCWYINAKNHLRQFSLAGSYEQEWDYFTNLLDSLDVHYAIRRRTQGKNKNSIVSITARSNLLTLGSYLYSSYEEDRIGLDRKFAKWQKIVDSYS